jgi:mRNA-degrading endonuclease toxin of MazEF toxin-antitoxin module
VPSKHYPFHVWLGQDLMPKPSVVLCNQLRTLAKERLEGDPIAELPPGKMTEVESAIRLQLDL